MVVSKNTALGNINITKEALATLVGGVVSECYGVVGMASCNIFKDGIAELLKHDNYSKGVNVKNINDKLSIDVYIVVGYGVKVSEVVIEVQKKIKYVTENTLQCEIDECNIYVQGIKELG